MGHSDLILFYVKHQVILSPYPNNLFHTSDSMLDIRQIQWIIKCRHFDLDLYLAEVKHRIIPTTKLSQAIKFIHQIAG